MIRIRFVARHLIVKTDNRVASGGRAFRLAQSLRQIRQLRLLRTFLAFVTSIAFVTYFLACVPYIA